MADRSRTTYNYDALNRLIEVNTPSDEYTFVYNSDNIRVRSSVNDVITDYLVDPARPYPVVLSETDENGAAKVDYFYGEELLSQRRGGVSRYYHQDGHCSTLFLTDPTGSLSDQYQYDAWGNVLSATGETDNRFLYAGESFEQTLGVYYLRNRYYDPRIGRFQTMDTWPGIQERPITLHKYLYAENNQVNRIDPSGQYSLVDVSAANAIRNGLLESQVNLGFGLMGAAEGDEQAAMEEIGFAMYFLDIPEPGLETRAGGLRGLRLLGRSFQRRSLGRMRNMLRGALPLINRAGLRNAARKIQNKAGKRPDLWGKWPSKVKEQNRFALRHLREIMRTPGTWFHHWMGRRQEFVLVKKLSDGRAAVLTRDYKFVTFFNDPKIKF